MSRTSSPLPPIARPAVAAALALALAAAALGAPAGPAAAAPRRAAEDASGRARAVAVGPSDYHRGISFGVVPLANYTSDTGFGFGAGVALIDYADGEEPFRNAFFLKGFITTRWVQHHAVQWEAPRLAGSDVSIWTRAEFRRQLDANYFGVGNTTDYRGALTDPDSPHYLTDHYYQYLQMGPTLVAQVRHPLYRKLGLIGGYTFRYLYIDPYEGSLLERERPRGYQGGFTSMLQAGIELDTRDAKPLTRSGHWVELAVRFASRYLGGSDTFGGVTLSDRHYWNPVGDLVLAHRLIVDLVFGEVPLDELRRFGDFGLTDGLGGAWSIRGHSANRYIGRVKVVLNPEVRQHIYTWSWWGARFDLGVVGFFDVGRVWADYERDGAPWNIHWGGGGGFRLAWNENFVARFEAAGSYEGAKFYVELFALF